MLSIVMEEVINHSISCILEKSNLLTINNVDFDNRVPTMISDLLLLISGTHFSIGNVGHCTRFSKAFDKVLDSDLLNKLPSYILP